MLLTAVLQVLTVGNSLVIKIVKFNFSRFFSATGLLRWWCCTAVLCSTSC